jgi:hypothetical protein
MFSSGSDSGFQARNMSMRQRMEEEKRRKKEKEVRKLEDERQRRGSTAKGNRMAGDAINAANEAGIDLEFDRLNKRRESNTARIQELQNQDSRSAFEDKELGARGVIDKRTKQQEKARRGMVSTGYTGGLESYDASSAGGKRFDLSDVNFLKGQGVDEKEIRAYIAGLSDKERAGSLRFGKGTGLYMGDMAEGSNASDYDFGNKVTGYDVKYLRNQGFGSDQINEAIKNSGLETGYFADRQINNMINNTTNNVNSNNRTSLNDVGNTKNSNNTNLKDVGNIKDSGNITDSGNIRDSLNTDNTATATGIGSGRQDVNNDISQTSNINTVGNNNYVYNPMLNFGSQNTTMSANASANSGNSGSGYSGSAADDLLGPYGVEDFGNSFNDYLENAKGLALLSTVGNTLQSQPGFGPNRASAAIDSARATLPVDLVGLNNTIGRRTNYYGDRAEIERAKTFGLPFTPMTFTPPPSYQRPSPPDLARP